MYEIQFRGKGGCQRAAFVEALLKFMGAKRLWNPRDDLRIIFDSQEEFKSPVFHVDYKLPAIKDFFFFRKWIYLTFRYEVAEDFAAIQFDGANKQIVQTIVDRLNLLQQATPNEIKERTDKFTELAKTIDPTQPIEVIEINKNAAKVK